MMAEPRTVDLQEIFIQDFKFRNLSQATVKDYDRHLSDIKRSIGGWAQLNRQKV